MEILNGTAGPGIQAYLKTTAPSSTEPPLTSETGLKNGPGGSRVFFCSDGNFLSDVTEKDLEAVVAEYSRVSGFFAGVTSQDTLICMGKLWHLPACPKCGKYPANQRPAQEPK
jgi:hypothetical protein